MKKRKLIAQHQGWRIRVGGARVAMALPKFQICEKMPPSQVSEVILVPPPLNFVPSVGPEHRSNFFKFYFQPQNIVLMGQFPNCEIKLCDLEVARVIKEDELIRDIIGTPDYVGKIFFLTSTPS